MTEIWQVVRLPPAIQREEFERYYTIRETIRRELFERLRVLLRPKHKNHRLTGGYV